MTVSNLGNAQGVSTLPVDRKKAFEVYDNLPPELRKFVQECGVPIGGGHIQRLLDNNTPIPIIEQMGHNSSKVVHLRAYGKDWPG